MRSGSHKSVSWRDVANHRSSTCLKLSDSARLSVQEVASDNAADHIPERTTSGGGNCENFFATLYEIRLLPERKEKAYIKWGIGESKLSGQS